MKKALIVFRSLLPLILLSWAAVHPGVILVWDRERLWFSAVLFPLSVIAGILFKPGMGRLHRLMLSFMIATLCLSSLLISGSAAHGLTQVLWIVGLVLTTNLAFHQRMVRILYADPLILAWAFWRIAGFSRASEDLAHRSLVTGIAGVAAFILLSLIYWALVYALEYRVNKPGRERRQQSSSKQLVPFLLLLVLPLLFFLLPSRLTEFKKPESLTHNPLDAGGSGGGEGLPDRGGSDGFGKRGRGNSGNSRQQIVLVIETAAQSLYLANSYNEILHPVRGFIPDGEYLPNRLIKAPLLETWKNPEMVRDGRRIPVTMSIYSAVSARVAPWLPWTIEPTVRDDSHYPLRYSWRATSLVSTWGSSGVFPPAPVLSTQDAQKMSALLELPLDESVRDQITGEAQRIVGEETDPGARIHRILKSFSNCTYDASGPDDTTVEAITRFLFDTRNGDCTEFSNAAALLGRAAGIPARVVTGYAARKELQTPRHRSALLELRSLFPPLARTDPDKLMLVTTAHAHSWVQFWITGAGWVDFETTQYAIPPETSDDPNSRDIALPRFEDRSGARGNLRDIFKALLYILLVVPALVILLWFERVIRRVSLLVQSRRPGETGTKARFALFLFALRARKFRRKRAEETAREYAASYAHAYPELTDIMEQYTRAVLHPSARERREADRAFRLEADRFLARKRGFAVFIRMVLCISVVLSVSCTNGNWTTFRGDGGSGRSSSIIQPPVAIRWKLMLSEHTGRDRFFNQPVIYGNTIYFGSSDGNFYAFDLTSGFMDWTIRTEGPINSVPYVDKKNVYFGSSDGRIYCADRKTGNLQWIQQTGGAVNSTFARYGKNILAASDADGLYMFTPDGEQILRLPNDYWYHNAFQINRGLLAFAPGTPTEPASLALYDMKAEEYLWTVDTKEQNYPWYSFPAISGRYIHYSITGLEEDGDQLGARIFCREVRTGRYLWEKRVVSDLSPEPLGDSLYSAISAAKQILYESTLLLEYGAPIVYRGRVMYAIGDSRIRAFAERNGDDKWERDYGQPVSSAMSLAGGRLYFGLRADGEDGYLVCAQASNGRELWRIPVDGSILNSPVVAGRRIVFGTDKGYFYVLEAAW